MGKNDLMIKTGADLLIQALQENGINKMYGRSEEHTSELQSP